MRCYTGNYILTPQGLKQNIGVWINEEGVVTGLEDIKNIPKDKIVKKKGILTPGFINAHCHLELSTFHQKIPQGTGMVNFIEQLTNLRNEIKPESQLKLSFSAFFREDQMYKNGIVAVADICNTLVTLKIFPEENPKIFIYNFLELFGMDENKAEDIFKDALIRMKIFPNQQVSITPHAPYSLSPVLFKKISLYATENNLPLSIHLLESQAERELFEHRKGDFMNFFDSIVASFKIKQRSVIEYIITSIPSKCKVLFVHNTEMQQDEYQQLCNHFPNAWFCLCPRANMYINEKMPPADIFYPSDKVCIGTDSLASNDSLSITEEIKLLRAYFPSIPLEYWLQCATINGAKFLGINNQFGSFEIGKKPGIYWITDL